MKSTLINVLFLFAILYSSGLYAQNTIFPEDLKALLGEWTGSLTYVDYNTNKPYTMPANLNVNQGKNENQLILNISYPYEPKANGRDKINISNDGSKLNKIDVKSREVLSNGQVQITTEYKGKDNNKKAAIKKVYLISNSQFIIRKEVKFEDTKDWLTRNEYKYSRRSDN